MRAGKEGKKESNVVQPPARKSGKKTAQATPSSETEKENEFCRLLREVQEDRKPIEALLNNPTFKSRFRSIIAAFKQKPEDAEELANDVLFKVSRSLHRFQPDYNREYGNFFPWLRKVTRNKFLDALPADDAEFSDEPAESLRVADPRIDLEAGVLHNELVANVERLVKTLPEKQRLAVTYFVLEGLTLRETAARLTEAGFPSTPITVRKSVSGILKDALPTTYVMPSRSRNEFGSVLKQAIQMMPDATAREGLLATGFVPYGPRTERPWRVRPTLLNDLETEFDGLLASMQTTQSKRAVQTAFEASPAQLGRAAVKHANKKR
jgi:antitoxin Phd